MDQITTAFTGLPDWVQIALAVALVIFGLAWVFNFLRILVGGEVLERRVAALRSNFFATYREGLARGLDGLASWIGDRHPQGPMPFSGSAYLTCLGLATLYPLFFITVSWAVLGGAATFAGMEVFPASATTAQRWLAVAAMVGPGAVAAGLRLLRFSELWRMAVAAVVTGALASASAYAGAYDIAVVFFVAAIGAIVGSVAGAGAIAGAYAGASTFLIAVVFAAAGAGAGAGAFASIIASAFTFAFAVGGVIFVAFFASVAATVADRNRRGWALVVPVGLLFLLPAHALALAGGEGWIIPLDQPHLLRPGQTIVAGPIVLFLALLPVVNAPFDWMSLGVTRAFLGTLSQTGEETINLFETPVIGQLLQLGIILINLAIALVLTALVVVFTAAGTALFSEVHVWAGGARLYDVPALIDHIRANPWDREWLWIYAMMFWTLVPTLVHFVAFAGAVTASVLNGIGFGKWLAGQLDAAHTTKRVGSVIGSSFVLTLLQLAPGIGAIYLVYDNLPWLLSFFDLDIATIGGHLADWAMAAARAIQG